MSRKVNFISDVSALSPSGSPNGGEGEDSMRDPESSPTEQASRDSGGRAWAPARLELRLRCERVDSDGSTQCVWMLQDDEAAAEYSFESLFFKGSKNDDKTPVVRQYAQRGNFWCSVQRKDNLALGAKGVRSDGWVAVTSTRLTDTDQKPGASTREQPALSRYVASLPLPDDFPGAAVDMVAQVRLRTRPFYTSTTICEGLAPEMLQFCAPRKDEAPQDADEDNDFTTLTQRFPLSSLAVSAAKPSVTLHLFNGRLSVRLQRADASNRWLVQAFRIIARIVPSSATRSRPASTGSASTGSASARSAPRTPAGAGAAVVAAKEIVGAGFYGTGVPGWRGKFFRAVRRATRLRMSKLLELMSGMQRINVRSAEKSAKSLHTTGMFILDTIDTLFLWLGSNTGKKQNVKAQDFVNKYIKMPFFDARGKSVQRAPYFKVSVLLGGNETTEFWYYIGGFGEVSRSGTMGEAALKAGLPSPRAAQTDLAERNQRPRVAVIGGGVTGCAAANFLQRNNVQCVVFERDSNLGGKLSNVPTKFFTFSGASAPMFCAKSPSFAIQVQQMVQEGVLMRWAPRVSVVTDDGVQHSLPSGGISAANYVVCRLCNATMSKSSNGVALMRLGCCFNIACAACFGTLWGIKPSAEIIVRTVETLAAQSRVLVCPVCDRRLVQIEQMVFDSQDAEEAPQDSPQAAGDRRVEHWSPNLARAAENGFGTEDQWLIGKGGMASLCQFLCRRVTVALETEILRLERRAGSHLYTLFKKVKADVSLRGQAAQDSANLVKPQELAVGSFDAVLCCLPPRAAAELMQNFLPAVATRARSVSYQPRWVLLLEFQLTLPVSIDVAFVKSVTCNSPLEYLCRESCRGGGNAQQKSSSSQASVIVPLKECGSRDSANSNLDRWVAHASCQWSAKNAELQPKVVAQQLAAVFLKILGMQQYSASNMHAVLWDEAVMAPLPRQRISAMDRRAFAMFNASPHCVWEPMKRVGAAGEWFVEASVEGAFTSGVAIARCSLNVLTQPNIKDMCLNSQNENEDRLREIEMEAKIERRRNLTAERAMVEAERLQKVLNVWFGRVLSKKFANWKSYVAWRRGGKAAHIANISLWRQQRDMKNAFKAIRNYCVKSRLQRKLESAEAEDAA